ncbi:hypothetical protein GQ43DRAFT_347063, partial [Delitschia confertaspora ATCC 74209]
DGKAPDDDVVVAEYDIFITPEMAQQLYLLQYVNRRRDNPYSQSNDNQQPVAIRIKEQSGFVEVDVPYKVHDTNFNRPQAVRWGEAVRKTKELGQKAWGFAAGFERAQAPPRGGPNRASTSATGTANTAPTAADDDGNIDQYLENFDDANEKGHVLNIQTLGGQIIKDSKPNAHYMVGTFRGNELHLTKVAGIVQMRPQFNHIDAAAQVEALNRRREREAQEGPRPAEARTVLMQQKRAESKDVEQARKFLSDTNDEKWTKLQYIHEEEQKAYDTYHDTLFVHDTESAPKLKSAMTADEYLEAISAPSNGKKKAMTKRQLKAIEVSDDSDSDYE